MNRNKLLLPSLTLIKSFFEDETRNEKEKHFGFMEKKMVFKGFFFCLCFETVSSHTNDYNTPLNSQPNTSTNYSTKNQTNENAKNKI